MCRAYGVILKRALPLEVRAAMLMDILGGLAALHDLGLVHAE